jgi:hypothetical protein
MPRDRNRLPAGWYVGSYLLRFVALDASGHDLPRKRFLSWENTVLVKATSPGQAYTKVEKIGLAKTRPCRGGQRGMPVRWTFEGVTDLLPMYERLRDGAEIMWTERSPRTLKTLRQLVRPKAALLRSLE